MKKTDNSYLDEKVQLRIDSIQSIHGNVSVLECYAGHQVLWSEVKKRSGRKKIFVTPIEKKSIKGKVYLRGDNLKFLKSINLSAFNVIDLDAYGIPFDQIDILFERGFSGIVHVTSIQSGMGRLPNKLLNSIGYTNAMIDKCPTMFCANRQEKLEHYLASKGVKEIEGYFIDRKNYFYFNM